MHCSKQTAGNKQNWSELWLQKTNATEISIQLQEFCSSFLSTRWYDEQTGLQTTITKQEME